MQRELCRAKLHRVTLNDTGPDYEGSLIMNPDHTVGRVIGGRV